jgi:hypothetical protein
MIQEQIEETNESCDKIKQKIADLQFTLEVEQYRKANSTNNIVVLQKLQRRYQDHNGGNYTFVQVESEKRVIDIGKATTKLTKIQNLITKIQENSTIKTKNVLKHISQFIDTTTDEISSI